MAKNPKPIRTRAKDIKRIERSKKWLINWASGFAWRGQGTKKRKKSED